MALGVYVAVGDGVAEAGCWVAVRDGVALTGSGVAVAAGCVVPVGSTGLPVG